ncbi:spindle pole body component 110-like [Nicotiana sylvestris]|uniref:spindle pole body component 110-like n=1 Tax=Nicotiana sylvestris TaxID=4096 RepID=UPI00388C67B3
MHDFIMAEDSELWDVICDGPYVLIKVLEELPFSMPKTSKEYTDADMKAVEKNFRAKKILVCGIEPDEYNRIFACDTSKEIWEALQTAHEGTTQVKQSMIDMLTTEYELFRMKDDESIQDMHTRFISIINELHSLGETIPRNKLELTIEEMVGNLKTYEMKMKIDSERRELKKEKNLVLKADSNDSSSCSMGGSSSESEDETDAGDSSMIVAKSEENEYDSTFALMAQSDDDKNDDNNEVNFRDVQRKLKSYSPKKLMSLANVLIDAYHNLLEDKDALILELGEVEQIRDDLVVCVVDLKETICELKKEKDVLTKKISNLEHKRDDLVVVVVDHKETIENFSKEKEALVKTVTEIEEERDDLLVVSADLRETMEVLGTKSKPGNTGKGKEIASEEHIRLENELKAVRTRMCVETEKNKHLQTELERGIGFQREKTPYNPHSKYVTVPENWLCTHCGNNAHFKENYQARVQFTQKNRMVVENGGSVSFGNGKKGYILGVGKICDKGNNVEFLSKICTVTMVTGEVLLVAKRYKNIYVADFESLQSGDLSCLKAIDDDAELWYRRLGHTSFSLLYKLIQKNMVHGLPMSKFKVQKVYDACARGKHVKSSFKSKRDVSTSKPLELLHMNLCGAMRDQFGKFDAKSDEGIFMGYSSQSKSYKIYNKQTQCVEESVHVVFDESYPSCEKSAEKDQDGEPLLVPAKSLT